MYRVYTEYILCIYCVYTEHVYTVYKYYILVYTRFIPSIYQVHPIRKHEGADRSWKVSVDLGLCCHRVTFNLTINLYHDAWLKPDWCLIDQWSQQPKTSIKIWNKQKQNFGLVTAQFILDLDIKSLSPACSKIPNLSITMLWQKLVVLWIKFPISPITHLHSTNYSSMVFATNTVTIAPYILIPTGIKYGRCDAQMTFNWYIHSINWISLREKW